MRERIRPVVLLLSAAVAFGVARGKLSADSVESFPETRAAHFVTNVAQFMALSGGDYLAGCDFRLTGVVTLVDTNRDLVVLQDATGAVALNFRIGDQGLQVGKLVTLDGFDCRPYFANFPDYPHRPSVRDVRSAFEAPADAGEYYLTRMRGYLHPPVTGEYTFWVSSDNSSELWLSLDADPSKARRIASVPRFAWVEHREWSRFPSQQSEPVLLKAGESYYIEALHEQTTGADHLSVAWQGPGLDRTVIPGRYLSPWREGRARTDAAAGGILREHWSNFAAGDLTGLAEARPFQSALSAGRVRARIHGPGPLPEPVRLALDSRWLAEHNYRWVEAEGLVRFRGADGDTAFLELSIGHARVQVRALHWSTDLSRRIGHGPVRIEGVCEAVYDQTGALIPGLIWASAANSISPVETPKTNAGAEALEQPALFRTGTNPGIRGFYGTRGVVTFNDRVFDNDYIFVQEDAAVVRVTLEDPRLKSHFEVGRWVDIGGALEPGKCVSVITPLVVTKGGWHSLPAPVARPLGFPAPANRDGRWSELEGVVHSVNANGTLSVAGKDGRAYLWMGQTPSSHLPRYVDAKLRARGVLLLAMLDAPVLLVPSRNFAEVVEEAPADPFSAPLRSIAGILPEKMASSWFHRVRVAGEVTYRDAQSFFVQDASGGIRVLTANQPGVEVGETVEVLAFPAFNGSARALTEPLARPAAALQRVGPRRLDFTRSSLPELSGALVYVSATLLARGTNGFSQVLELQEQQRVFTAVLASGQGRLPDIATGSRLRVTGVCEYETAVAFLTGEKPARAQTLASFNILLRSPGDVIVLGGPPWWTWKRTATLVAALLAVLVVALLWIHLLRRRLERQRTAQLAFSRLVLERLESERQRIAANLHDGLGQVLLAVKNQALLAMQRPPDEPGLRQRLEEISGATSQALEEVRQITRGLRPHQLDRLGLTQAIRTSVSQAAANSPISFAIRVEDIDGLFDKDAEIHVYRIVQEAVTNAVKHSGATEAAAVVKKRAAGVSLAVRDNGRGFDPAKLSAQPHDLGYGLGGISERARILGANLTIDSRPGEGASLTVEVPLPARKT